MAEQNSALVDADNPTGWWVSYKTAEYSGIAIGWLLTEQVPGLVRMVPHVWRPNIAGVDPVTEQILTFQEKNIVAQGPVLLGRKVSREEHEAAKQD